MNLTLSLKDVHALSNALVSIDGKQKPKLLFAISKNKDKISKIVQTLHEQYTNTIPKSYADYDKERGEILEKYRKELDLPMGVYEFGDKTPEVEKEIIALADGKYKSAIDEYTEAMKEFDELLLEETEINLHQVDASALPKNIDINTFEALKPMIKDVYVFDKKELSKIDIVRTKLIRTVNMVKELGNMVDSATQRGIMLPTDVVRKLSYFVHANKKLTDEIIELRTKHAKIPEFVEYVQKKNVFVLDKNLDDDAVEEQVAKLDQTYSEEVLATFAKAEEEMRKATTEVLKIDVAKIDINTFDDDLDSQIFEMLLPLIQEEQ